MDEFPYLGLGAEYGFSPMILALHILFSPFYLCVMPKRICDRRGTVVNLKISVGIPGSDIQPVIVMLVLHDIEINANLSIGSLGLIGNVCGLFLMVTHAVTQFHNREIPVLQIDTQACFILALVTEHFHRGSYEFSRDLHTLKPCCGIRNVQYLLALRLGCS